MHYLQPWLYVKNSLFSYISSVYYFIFVSHQSIKNKIKANRNATSICIVFGIMNWNSFKFIYKFTFINHSIGAQYNLVVACIDVVNTYILTIQ